MIYTLNIQLKIKYLFPSAFSKPIHPNLSSRAADISMGEGKVLHFSFQSVTVSEN